jgi:hypothetical protein
MAEKVIKEMPSGAIMDFPDRVSLAKKFHALARNPVYL